MTMNRWKKKNGCVPLTRLLPIVAVIGMLVTAPGYGDRATDPFDPAPLEPATHLSEAAHLERPGLSAAVCRQLHRRNRDRTPRDGRRAGQNAQGHGADFRRRD
jgi:hypothetical protein